MASRTQPEPPRTTTESAPETRPEPVDLPLDVVYGLLSNERRRRVLRYLLDGSEPATLGELAEHVASIENDKPEHALSSAERKRVYIVLYQAHLPKMDDADVIDFDEDRKTVELAENAEHVATFLPAPADPEPSDKRGRLAAAVANFVSAIWARIRNAR